MKTSIRIALACALAASSAAPTYAEPTGGSRISGQVDRDRVVCRRFLRTGSLVDSYRTCKTNREWQREHENLQRLSATESCRDRANGGSLCGP
jgi:hypothetical protein